MGGILAVAFITYLQHRIRIGLQTDRVSNNNGVTDLNKDDGEENIQGENFPGHYWTIVSNERGELNTAIEMNLEQHSEPRLIAQTMVHIDNESEEILRSSNIIRKEELDGYLNPVHSIPMEFDNYIHPVHSDSVNAISASSQYIEIL
ncbi:hypothetical protein CHS0354_025636 [Potamilus streckersoni]|uniref:Uncharacterized protein n=1 Tax=Potamilus streckersoni TaxID=2493646 RepID=A0AAE0S1I6_9BIVA|nr:hypothetical protein CHS0354_025636 [Potamilus streckersoni]